MDLHIYFRVLWRFRWLVIAGVLLAALLAFLSVVSISFDRSSPFSYRESEEWTSDATLLVTQEGFPLGRSIYDEVVPLDAKTTVPSYVPRFSDPQSFAALAVIYARIAVSDTVQAVMRQEGPLNGTIRADTLVNENNDATLPIIAIRGFASTPAAASSLAARGSRALRDYITGQQIAAGIAQDKRVVLGVLNEPTKPRLVSGRSPIRPFFVFLTVLLVTVGLVFVLENLQPRKRPAPLDEPTRAQDGEASHRAVAS